MSDREAWTAEITKKQMHASLAKLRNKYGAKKVEVGGVVFDSKKEYARWCELVLEQQAGHISELRRQEPFDLFAWVCESPADTAKEKTVARSVGQYVADFTYRRNGRRVVEDVKSPATRKIALYVLKRKIIAANYNLDIVEI